MAKDLVKSTDVPENILETIRIADRCDRCGAQAFVRATLPSLHPLLFCGHHYRKHEAALLETGVTIKDERYRINKKPTAPKF